MGSIKFAKEMMLLMMMMVDGDELMQLQLDFFNI